MDTSEDPDTEEALKGFDFLSSTDEMDTSPESRGNGDGTDWGEFQAVHRGNRVMCTVCQSSMMAMLFMSRIVCRAYKSNFRR